MTNGEAMPDDDRFAGMPEEDESHARRTRTHVQESETKSLAPFIPIDELFAKQQDAAFLVPALGIAPGAATGFFGQGFVGKTIIAQDFGISVALGQPLFGVYSTRRGKVIHLDHEQGLRITATRYQRMARVRGAWADDFRGWLDVAIHPRLNLTTPGAEDHYVRLFDGHALAIVDALKGATPGIDENSSEMRDYMGRLSRASERTGCAVLLIHHAGKTVVGGERPRKESGRGSSAIFDECQSVFVLTAGKGEPIRVSHEKDRELGHVLDDFGMRVEDVEINGDPRAGLRVTHLEGEQLASGDAEAALRRESLETKRACDAIRTALVRSPGPFKGSREDLRGAAGVGAAAFGKALALLQTGNSVTKGGTYHQPEWIWTGGSIQSGLPKRESPDD